MASNVCISPMPESRGERTVNFILEKIERTLPFGYHCTVFAMKLANQTFVYGSVVITSTRKVLVVKGRKSGKWSFPKGHAEQHETELDCALRETHEETGLQLSKKFDRTLQLATGVYFLYLLENEIQCTPNDTNEITELSWVPIHTLKYMNVNVDINTFLRSYGHQYIHNSIQSSGNSFPKPLHFANLY